MLTNEFVITHKVGARNIHITSMSVVLESIYLCIKYMNALLESIVLFSCLFFIGTLNIDISIIIEAINYSIDIEIRYDKIKISRYR